MINPAARHVDGAPFVREVRLDAVPQQAYPYTLPVVQALVGGGLAFQSPVTMLVGDNGTGKSTLVEAVAVAAGFNPEGGSPSFQFATRASESELGAHLVVSRVAGHKPSTGFFLRAESYYNVATEIERLDQEPGGPPLLPAYGGVSPHERSHGESFLDLVVHRFGPNGLYLLDEPEAALSVYGCLALLTRIRDLVAAGSQFVIATHSPILLAIPDATIYQIDGGGGIEQIDYDAAEPVVLTREFLSNPQQYMHHLFAADD